MTGGLLSVPMSSIQRHTRLQNRNISASRRREKQEGTESKEHISKLAQSIRENGLQKPLEIVPMTAQEAAASGKQYWLVGGHHRLAALQLLSHSKAPITLLDGEGFQQARKHSYLQNEELFRQLQDDQRICNAWRAMNDPDICDYRDMTEKEIATMFSITERTVQRMKEVRRRWAAKEVDFDYEQERAIAKKDGQRGIRAFNQLLDEHCLEHLQYLYTASYGHLKKELERGTEQATLEERALIKRTVPVILEALGAYGLHNKNALLAALEEATSILSKSKSYYEACDTAGSRYLDSASGSLERFYREQELERAASEALIQIDANEASDF